MWCVLVVATDSEESSALMQGLGRRGHEVRRAVSGNEALDMFEDVDFVLLDPDLPDIDGLEVCRAMRASSDTPIITVARLGAELDRVMGLRAGADDYLVAPHGIHELLARMEAVMRRVHPAPDVRHVVSHGPLRIDSRTREVIVSDRAVDLTRKEFDLLFLLASQPDSVVPRTRIMSQVWGGSWSQRTVDTHVSNLRTKLGDRGWIVTVRGVGFRIGSASALSARPAV